MNDLKHLRQCRLWVAGFTFPDQLQTAPLFKSPGLTMSLAGLSRGCVGGAPCRLSGDTVTSDTHTHTLLRTSNTLNFLVLFIRLQKEGTVVRVASAQSV